MDEKLVKMDQPSIQCLSFEQSTALERIGAMCISNVLNAKAKLYLALELVRK